MLKRDAFPKAVGGRVQVGQLRRLQDARVVCVGGTPEQLAIGPDIEINHVLVAAKAPRLRAD